MSEKRRLLLVEDLPLPYESLKTHLETNGWAILHATDTDSALRRMEQAQAEAWPIEIAVVDLGLPPGPDNPLRGGLPLIDQLRELQENLPIMAYTSIPPTSVNYAYLIARLLPLRVSLIYLRRMITTPTFADLVELAWKGYFFLSPEQADHLPTAVTDRPDPLNDDLWETLELISSNMAQKEVAARLGNITKDAVKNRVSRIKELLLEAGELELYQNETRDIVDWYQTHHIRYRRFPRITSRYR
jgi:CheY-like chemotaxis protein